MNRSYSKIRHIQEVNQRLEKRLMSEQVQTTVTQTGENPGTKTKINPPMSKAIPEISGDTPQDKVNAFSEEKFESFKGNTVNLYTDRENRKFKRQIRIDYMYSGLGDSKDKLGKIVIAYKYEEVKLSDGTDYRVGNSDHVYFLSYSCDKPDQLIPFDTKLFTGPQGIALYSKYFTDKLKKDFCTVGSGGSSVPKGTYASTGKPQQSNLA